MSEMKKIYITGLWLLCIVYGVSAQTYDIIERRNSWNTGKNVTGIRKIFKAFLHLLVILYTFLIFLFTEFFGLITIVFKISGIIHTKSHHQHGR